MIPGIITSKALIPSKDIQVFPKLPQYSSNIANQTKHQIDLLKFDGK